MAGAFGFEAGERNDVSIAVGEQGVLPAVRRAGGAAVVADGFSCREQIRQRTPRRARHLAEVLAGRGSGERLPRLPLRATLARAAAWTVAGAIACVGAALLGWSSALRRRSRGARRDAATARLAGAARRALRR